MSTRLAMIACAVLVSACSTVPRSGPLTGDVIGEAAAPVALGFEYVETTGAVVARLEAAEGRAGLTRLAGGPAVLGRHLRTGDQVQVVLFEATGGGLFGGGVDGPGGVRELPVQTVSAGGTIRIPYGGAVRVAGLSPEAAAARIEASLAGQAIEPQAVVSLVASPAAMVTVIGDAVARGGRVPLSGTGERVLDMVAAAGGLTRPIHESALRLTRKDGTAVVGVGQLLEEPAQNVAVQPADLISVEHRPRTFNVLGAVTENARLTFDQTTLALDEALAMARGLVDARADPEGVFVIRYEDRALLGQLPGIAPDRLAAHPPGLVPTVYRVDFAQPSGLLLAKRFPVRDRDTLYVANAAFNSLEKVLRVVSMALQPVATGAVIGNLATN